MRVPDKPLIALISATPAAIGPAAEAIVHAMPAATVWNLLDDRLLVDAQEAGGVNRALSERMTRLIEYAVDAGADAVLLTCSQYGAVAVDAAAADDRVPILGADEAAFLAVAEGQFARVLVLASLETALRDSTERLGAVLSDQAAATDLVGRVAPGAAGLDVAQLVDLLADVAGAVPDVDAVLLAQYSLSPAQSALAGRLRVPVIVGPVLAAQRLAQSLSNA